MGHTALFGPILAMQRDFDRISQTANLTTDRISEPDVCRGLVVGSIWFGLTPLLGSMQSRKCAMIGDRLLD